MRYILKYGDQRVGNADGAEEEHVLKYTVEYFVFVLGRTPEHWAAACLVESINARLCETTP